MKSWILVLGALADFNDTTTESLFQLWDFINSHTPERHTFDEVSRELKQIEEISGVSLPYKKASPGPIKSKGDLDRFIRQMEQGTLLTHIAFIAKPIIEENLLSDSCMTPFFRKVCSLNEEISQGRISTQDIE